MWWGHFPCCVPLRCTMTVCLWNKEALVCVSVCLSACLPPGWSDDVCLSVCLKAGQQSWIWEQTVENGGKTHTWRGFKKGKGIKKKKHRGQERRAEEKLQRLSGGGGGWEREGEKERVRQGEWEGVNGPFVIKRLVYFLGAWTPQEPHRACLHCLARGPHRLPDIPATGPESQRGAGPRQNQNNKLKLRTASFLKRCEKNTWRRGEHLVRAESKQVL